MEDIKRGDVRTLSENFASICFTENEDLNGAVERNMTIYVIVYSNKIYIIIHDETLFRTISYC